MITHPTPDRHDVEDATHRAHCAECTALWAELEAISAEAARLPQLSPSRDLWSGIEARLAAPGATRVLPLVRRPAFRLAVAASLLVAVTSAVTWRLASAPDGDPATTVAATDARDAADAPTPGSGVYLAGLDETVGAMDREIAELETLVRERRDELDPATLAVLERNLAVIDTAIAESRAALAADPASKTVTRQYTRAYAAKLTLLRDAATLPTGI